jgi:hypothetical protein
MLIVYRKGDIRNQIIAWGADRQRSLQGMYILCPAVGFALTSFTELEAMLIMTGAVDPPDRPLTGDRRENNDDSEDEDDDDISSRVRSKVTRTNARTARNIRSSENDSGSDFEFDM